MIGVGLLILAIGYIAFATVTIWHRPGFFAAVVIGSYGLAAFFGPVGTLAAIVAIAACATARLANNDIPQGLAPADAWLLLFMALILIGVFTSPQLDSTLNFLSLLVGLSCFTYIYARTFALHPTFIRDMFWGISLVSTITFIKLISASTKLARLGQSGDTGLGPIGLAILCELSFIPALAILMFDKEAKLPVKVGLLAFMGLIVLPFIATTGTRSVVLSCGIVFLIFTVVFLVRASTRARLGMMAVVLAGVPALVVAFIAVAPGKLFLLVAQGAIRYGGASGGVLNSRSSQERLGTYGEAFDLFRDAPVFGTGVGSYGYLADGLPDVYPHNLELELMVTGGVVGLVLFFLFLAPPFMATFKELVRKPPRWDRMAVGGILISTFVRHQVSFSFTAGKLLFFAAGCFVAWQLAERKPAPAPELPNPSPDEASPRAA